MKIQKIKLTNIRSHVGTEVDLKKGINVFTGRTGSGKSTVLIGISYALFGSDAGISNAHLLKRGKKNGSVELECL